MDVNINTKTAGTCLRGYIDGPTHAELERALGDSLGPSGDGKVRAEWTFTTVYGVATLYDWKNDAALHGVSNWHVGGHHPGVVHEVAQFLRNQGFDVQERTTQWIKPLS